MAEEASQEPTDDIPIPVKPLSGGISGMPSWSDYMKQLEQEGGEPNVESVTTSAKKPTSLAKKVPAKKATAPPVVSEEEEEKKRLKKEQEEKRRQEMKALMTKKKQEKSDTTNPDQQADQTPQNSELPRESSVMPTEDHSSAQNEESPVPAVPPKPLSGGVSGMPSWSDYLKQMEEQGGAPEEIKEEPKQPVKKVPAKKATAPPVVSEEEEEKKRLRKEQEEKRRQEMKELMSKKKQEQSEDTPSKQITSEQPSQILTEPSETEETTPVPPKPLSGGVSGMPSWSDYLKQMEEQGGAPEEPKEDPRQSKPPVRKAPAKKATAPPVLSEEEEEKKRLKKEQEEKRRQEMKELMAKKKQEQVSTVNLTTSEQQPSHTPTEPSEAEETTPVPPKPLSGGVSGMPSWSDYLKQMEEQGGAPEEIKEEPKQPAKKAPAKKATAPPVVSEEEEEKKRLKKEQEEKRRQEMKELMLKKKQESAATTPSPTEVATTTEAPQEEEAPLVPPKPISGGVSGMPSWSDYLKQMEEQGGSPEESKQELSTSLPKKAPAKKATAPPVVSEEEEEKKRLKKEQEEKRRQEMKALMTKKKQEKSEDTTQPQAVPPVVSAEEEEEKKKLRKEQEEKRRQEMKEMMAKKKQSANASSPETAKREQEVSLKPSENTDVESKPVQKAQSPAPSSKSTTLNEKPSPQQASSKVTPPVSLPTPSASLSLLAKIPPSRTYQAATVQDIALTLNSFKDNSINFDEVFAPDRSVENPKYSKKDMIEVKKLISEQAQEELTVLAKKLVDIKNKYQQETIERERVRDTISRQEKILEVLPGLVEKLNLLKRNLIQKEKQFADLKTSFDQMRKTNESLVQNEALMKDDIVKTQKAIEYSRDQFASIKLTAEKKLEASNKEIILLREQNEIGKFMVNSKILKEQQSQTSLKARLSIFENDNAQLLNLCDSIMQKIDTFNQQKQSQS